MSPALLVVGVAAVAAALLVLAVVVLPAGPSRVWQVPGFFIMHMTVNPYIEIAADGMSAKSHWLSPGAVGSNSSARWVWGPYYIDYVKEDGAWKILHTNLAALFRNAYEKSWAESQDHGTVTEVLTDKPDAPPTLYRPYNELKQQTDIFKNHPKLPEPY